MRPNRLRLVRVGLVVLLLLILTSLPAMTRGSLFDRIANVAGDSTILLTSGQQAAIQGAEFLLLLNLPPSSVYLPMVIR